MPLKTQPFLACLLALTVTGNPCYSQDPDDDELRSGLIATYQDDGGSIERVEPAIGFVWAGTTPDRRIGAAFKASWRGFLMSQNPGDYRLAVYASGSVVIRLRDEIVLQSQSSTPKWMITKPLPLQFDWHPLEIGLESTSAEPQIRLFWQGPGFQLEPVGERYLYHDPQQTPDGQFQRGELLAHALRCGSCHEIPGQRMPLPAPSLRKLAGHVHTDWLIAWLSGDDQTRSPGALRRMPHFDLSKEEAALVGRYLTATSQQGGSQPDAQPGSAVEGERLFLSLGCLACHQNGEYGTDDLFTGGDLTRVAQKRPASFFSRWLADPASINADHRMPVFQLSDQERKDLAAYLATLGAGGNRPTQRQPDDSRAVSQLEREEARRLINQNRCANCHGMPEDPPARKPALVGAIGPASDWSRACTGAADQDEHRPGFGLSKPDQAAVQSFVRAVAAQDARGEKAGQAASAEHLVAELNCLGCHARGADRGLAEKVAHVVEAKNELAPLAPAMTPPSLNSVGDKLFDSAIHDTIRRAGDPHRPWLMVRMPKFKISDQEVASLVKYLVDADRIPGDVPVELTAHAAGPVDGGSGTADQTDRVFELAGRRLVTTDGFGCTSCHQIGKTKPPKAPLNAMGPDLTLLGRRIRHEWFQRWVRNPARIVPRMEMPSVKIPVPGVLDSDLPRQLASVWHVLNKTGFQPPEPNPVRILRRSGVPGSHERPVVSTDVLKVGEQILVKPLLIGLPNRHNVLLDLESHRLAGWTIGDIAAQRTKGKTWFWQLSGEDLLGSGVSTSDILLVRDGKEIAPRKTGQFTTEFDTLNDQGNIQTVSYRLHFPIEGGRTRVLRFTQSFSNYQRRREASSGFMRTIQVKNLEPNEMLRVKVASPDRMANFTINKRGQQATSDDANDLTIELIGFSAGSIEADGTITVKRPESNRDTQLTLVYRTGLPVDQFPVSPVAMPNPPPVELQVVPGFAGVRLPINSSIMPTGMDWIEWDGSLVLTDLKGQVWIARDTDRDGMEDEIKALDVELAAPFGVASGPGYLDVINKYALVRIHLTGDWGRVDGVTTLASGWGHTYDYHDWAMGLPRDAQGNYYIATACQQDDRSEAAAHLRGRVMRLVPREPTADDPRQFAIQQISGGHRFPCGIARNRAGDLFVTDNQGNYNPFNELNHVLPGKRFGFINKLERDPDFKPNLTAPAINIPHPWTRSVNGICFLETPQKMRQSGTEHFGPFEGHLVGCEYDTRRLVRMSLQMVGGAFQGATYPFSYYEPPEGPPLLGPLACAVSPKGDLHVAGIRESGWGGANNIGNVVRLTPDFDNLPAGVAEVKAVKNGFAIDFTRAVDATRAADIKNYSIASYTRISTPAYGGPDHDRRSETISSVLVNPTATQVTVILPELREGYVYEIRLRNLAVDKAPFFPAEAYYSLNQAIK